MQAVGRVGVTILRAAPGRRADGGIGQQNVAGGDEISARFFMLSLLPTIPKVGPEGAISQCVLPIHERACLHHAASG